MINRLDKTWRVDEKIPSEIDEKLSDYPAGLRQLLYNRSISTSEQAQQYLEAEGSLYSPYLLKGMEEAVQRLLSAIDKGETIVVYGDYDVDGISAAAILVNGLQRLGAKVSVYLPNRFEEGYGLNVQAVRKLHQEGVHLLITVDCGIRSVKEIEIANDLGMHVILTDHHQTGEHLPLAFSLINPKQSEDLYPDKHLSGVGLAWKIILALSLRRPEAGIHADEYIDLVAIGTVADIVPLVGENRSLVKAGLKRLRAGANLGLRALAGAAGLENLKTLSARDIAFILAPRLNAAGRLHSAKTAYDLLTCADPQQAAALAQDLDNWNRKRQTLVNDLILIARRFIDPQGQDILLAFSPEFHQGVVGLVASRLAEEYFRPAMIGQQNEDFTIASCRSIPEFHITHALNQCSDLLEKHGGHEMAAGFTIRNQNLPEFQRRIQEISKKEIGNRPLQPTLRADLEIPLYKLPFSILQALEKIEPTGNENPEVVFVSRDLKVVFRKTVGNEGAHLSLRVADRDKSYQAIAFRMGHLVNELPEKVDLLYRVVRNEFNGLVSTQLHVIDIKPAASLIENNPALPS